MKLPIFTLCGLAAATTAAQANIVANAGFELGDGTDAASWSQLEIFGGAASASTVRDSSMARTGDWAMRLSVTGAPDFGPVAEIQQQTVVGSVVGGLEYNFSFWAMGTAGPGSVAFYEVLWFDGDGSDGGGPQGSATGLQMIAFGAEYAEFGMMNLLAPSTADSVLIQIRLVTGAFDGASGEMFIDDVSFALVPTPGTLAMAGLAGLAGLRRRR